MAFDKRFLEQVDAAREVEIETRRPDGKTRRTIIWVVVDDGRVYVRSVQGAGGKWYQRLLADPAGALHVGGTAASMRAVAVDDPAEIQRVSAALRKKYARQAGSLARMLMPETLPTTTRLEPLGQ